MIKNFTKYLLVACILNIFSTNFTFSGNTSEEVQTIIDKMPKLASGGLNNAGKDFWWSVPPCYQKGTGTNDLIKIFIVSSSVTKVTMEIPAKGIFFLKTTAPG